MEYLNQIIDFFIHLDHHIGDFVQHYGAWTYLLLFLIIFCETGLVVTPFLPGDSLLFVVGALAAGAALEIKLVLFLLSLAAVFGNILNYSIGRLLAPQILRHKKIRFIKQEHLDRTHQFFEKYGGKAIIFSRFMPIIRTLAPFLAGAGRMSYPRFLTYNLIGGTLWVCGFVLSGYFFGNMPVVKKNFTLVIFVIIIVSVLPGVVEYWKHKKEQKQRITS